MLVTAYFVLKPELFESELLKENPMLLFKSFNSALIFMGLAVSFSSLQDTSKTQNKLSKKIWEDPLKGKIMIILISCLIFLFLIAGLIGYFKTTDGILNEVSVGIIILGLGMFGFLKAMIEMFENHRKDKNSAGKTLQDKPFRNKSNSLTSTFAAMPKSFT